tara:strand:- start:58 stop:417 length:360 start_codon:yes stop_codon:yes gene_type:complete
MLEFYTDDDIVRLWENEYGSVTVVSFMIYGSIGKRDIKVINYAIRDNTPIEQFAQTAEVIDWEMAELFDVHLGTCIQWIFAGDFEHIELVKEIISDGLNYQRIKHECFGVFGDVYERTT